MVSVIQVHLLVWRRLFHGCSSIERQRRRLANLNPRFPGTVWDGGKGLTGETEVVLAMATGEQA